MKVSSFAEIEKEFTERAHAMVWCNISNSANRRVWIADDAP